MSNVPEHLKDKFERCVEDVMAQGHTKDSAIGICYSSVVEGKAIDPDVVKIMASEKWAGWLDIRKLDAEQRIVEGFASTEAVDGQAGIWFGQSYEGDVVGVEAIKDALPDYMKWANLREMHQISAVGTIQKAEVIERELEIDGQKYRNPLHVVAKVVDDDAWKKIKEGVYKGFSIGGKVIKAALEKLAGKTVRRVIKMLLYEISLVDRPANPEARILLWKVDASSPPDGSMQKKSYPWEQCIRDQTERYGSEETARRVCGTIRAKYGHKADVPESDIVYEGNLDSILADVEGELGIQPVKVNPNGGKEVKKQANIQKVADPTKALGMLQTLRNEAELEGDLESASLYSQAIALLLQASGEAEEAEETTEEVPAEGESAPESGAETPEEELQMVTKPKLRKAGRTFSGSNVQAMHGVIQALAQMLTGAGDTIAAKVLECYGAPAEGGESAPPAENKTAVISDADLQKIQGAIGAQVETRITELQGVITGLQSRVEVFERTPQPGGPILRPVDKTLAGSTEIKKLDNGDQPVPNIAELRRLTAITPDPVQKAEYARQLWEAEHATAK